MISTPSEKRVSCCSACEIRVPWEGWLVRRLIRVQSDIKQYNTRCKCSLERWVSNVALNTYWLVILNNGLLTSDQIVGAAPLPFPSPWGGLLEGHIQSFSVYFPSDSMYEVLQEWTIFWSLVRVNFISSLVFLALCSASVTMLWKNRL